MLNPKTFSILDCVAQKQLTLIAINSNKFVFYQYIITVH